MPQTKNEKRKGAIERISAHIEMLYKCRNQLQMPRDERRFDSITRAIVKKEKHRENTQRNLAINAR